MITTMFMKNTQKGGIRITKFKSKERKLSIKKRKVVEILKRIRKYLVKIKKL